MARILLAEDDRALARVFGKILQAAGHQVEMVENGEEGLRKAAVERPPDLLMTDIMMPGCDGESLAMVLGVILPNTPVMVVTASSDEKVLSRLEEAENVAVVLRKPVTRDGLLEGVETALARRG